MSRRTTRTSSSAGAPDGGARAPRCDRDADAVLIATPEYNHSIPGPAEERARLGLPSGRAERLNGKSAAGIGASKSMFGAVWAKAELRKARSAAMAAADQAELPVARAAGAATTTAASSSRPEQSEQLEEILAELVAEVEELAALRRRGLDESRGLSR